MIIEKSQTTNERWLMGFVHFEIISGSAPSLSGSDLNLTMGISAGSLLKGLAAGCGRPQTQPLVFILLLIYLFIILRYIEIPHNFLKKFHL
jgi:hypothetical protein